MLRMSSAIEDARKKIISTKKTIRTRGLKMIDGILRGSNGACASDCGDAWSSVVSALLEKKQSLAEDSETLKVFRRVIRVAHETASGSLRKFSKEIWEIGIVVLLEFRGGGRGSTDDTFSLLEASKIMSFMLEHPAYALILPIQSIKQILKRIAVLVQALTTTSRVQENMSAKIKLYLIRLIRQFVVQYPKCSQLKFALPTLFDFFEKWAPSRAHDTPLNREYVACMSAVLRRFPLRSGPNMLRTRSVWIVRLWERVQPECMTSMRIVEYMRLRIRSSQMLARCQGLRFPRLCEEYDDMLRNRMSLLTDALDRATQIRFLLMSASEKRRDRTSRPGSASYALSQSRQSSEDNAVPVAACRGIDLYDAHVTRAVVAMRYLDERATTDAEQHRNVNSHTLNDEKCYDRPDIARLVVAADLTILAEFYASKRKFSQRCDGTGTKTSRKKSGIFAPDLNRANATLSSQRAFLDMMQREKSKNMPPTKIVTTLNAHLRLMHATLCCRKEHDDAYCSTVDEKSTVDQTIGTIASLLHASFPYGLGIAELSARILTKMFRMEKQRDNMEPTRRDAWEGVRRTCLASLLPHRWTCASARDGFGFACVELLRTLPSSSSVTIVSNALDFGILVPGFIVPDSSTHLDAREAVLRRILQWWTRGITVQFSSRPSGSTDAAMHGSAVCSARDVFDLLYSTDGDRCREMVTNVEKKRREDYRSKNPHLRIGRDMHPSHAETNTFRFVPSICTDVFGNDNAIKNGCAQSDTRSTKAEAHHVDSDIFPLPLMQRSRMLRQVFAAFDATRRKFVKEDSEALHATIHSGRRAFASSALLAMQRFMREFCALMRRHCVSKDKHGEEMDSIINCETSAAAMETTAADCMRTLMEDASLEDCIALFVVRRISFVYGENAYSRANAPLVLIRSLLKRIEINLMHDVGDGERSGGIKTFSVSSSSSPPQHSTSSPSAEHSGRLIAFDDSDDDDDESTKASASDHIVRRMRKRARPTGVINDEDPSRNAKRRSALRVNGTNVDEKSENNDNDNGGNHARTARTYFVRQILVALQECVDVHDHGRYVEGSAHSGNATIAPSDDDVDDKTKRSDTGVDRSGIPHAIARACADILTHCVCAGMLNDGERRIEYENIATSTRDYALQIFRRTTSSRRQHRSTSSDLFLLLASLGSVVKLDAVMMRTHPETFDTKSLIDSIDCAVEYVYSESIFGSHLSTSLSSALLLLLRELALIVPVSTSEAEDEDCRFLDVCKAVKRWLRRFGKNKCAWAVGSVKRTWLCCAVEWFRADVGVFEELLTNQALFLVRDASLDVRSTASAAVGVVFPERYDDLSLISMVGVEKQILEHWKEAKETSRKDRKRTGVIRSKFERKNAPRIHEKMLTTCQERATDLSIWQIVANFEVRLDAQADIAFVLGEVVQRSANISHQRRALYLLCRYAQVNTDRLRLAKIVINTAARSLGFESGEGAALLASHLEFLLSMWIRDGISVVDTKDRECFRAILTSFPFSLLGPMTKLSTFLRGCVAHLLSICLLQSEPHRTFLVEVITQELEDDIDTQDSNIRKIIEANTSQVYGSLLPLSLSKEVAARYGGYTSENAKSGMEYCMRRVGGESAFLRKCTKHPRRIADIIYHIFDCAFSLSGAERTDFISTAVRNSLTHVASQYRKTVPQLMKRAGGVRLLHRTNMQLLMLSSTSERAKERSRRRWLLIFKMMLEMMCDEERCMFDYASILRFGIKVVCRELSLEKNPNEYDRICLEIVHFLLIRIRSPANSSKAHTRTTDDGNEDIIESIRAGHTSQVIWLLERRVDRDRLHTPADSTVLTEIVAAIRGLKKTLPEEDIADAAIDEGTAHCTRNAGIRYFLSNSEMLWQNDAGFPRLEQCVPILQTLLHALKRANDTAEPRDDTDKDDVAIAERTSAARKLLSILRIPSLPVRIKRLAASCLGRLGATDHSRRSNRRERGSDDVRVLLRDLRVAALLQVAECLVRDDNPDVLDTASRTAEKMIQSTDGKEALQALPPRTRHELAPYTRPVLSHASEIEKGSVGPRSASFDKPLRRTDKQSFDRWICDLTARISACAAAARAPFLKACEELVKLDATFAATVFPLSVVMALRYFDEEGDVTASPPSSRRDRFVQQLGREITETLMNDVTVGRRGRHTQRLIIQTLLLLRRFKLLETTTSQQEDTLSSSRSSSPHSGTRKSLRKGVRNRRSLLRVPPLIVAEAALRCEMYAVALLFLDFRTRTNAQDAERRLSMLIRTYTNINEPDGGCGITAMADGEDRCDRADCASSFSPWTSASIHYGSSAPNEMLTSVNAQLLSYGRDATTTSNLRASSEESTLRLVGALHREGLYAVSSLCIDSFSDDLMTSSSRLAELRYEAAYRMGRWDLQTGKSLATCYTNEKECPSSSRTCERGSQGLLFQLIRAVRSHDVPVYTAARARLISLLTDRLAGRGAVDERTARLHLNLRGGKGLLTNLVTLQSLGDIEATWATLQKTSSSLPTSASLDHVVSRWYANDDVNLARCFELSEPLDAVREGILRGAMAVASKSVASSVHPGLLLARHLCRIAKRARQTENRLKIASAALCRLRNVVADDAATTKGASVSDWVEWEFEEARCLWAMGEHRRATIIGRRLCSTHAFDCTRNRYVGANLAARLLLTTGEWLAFARSESSAIIHSRYLSQAATKAAEACTSTRESRTFVGETSFKVAQYVDGLHRKLLVEITSNEARKRKKDKEDLRQKIRGVVSKIEVERKKIQSEGKRKESSALKSASSSVRKKLKLLRGYHRELKSKLESLKRSSIVESDAVETYLVEAIGHYKRCMEYSDVYDTPAASRIIAIWLQQKNGSERDEQSTATSNDANDDDDDDDDDAEVGTDTSSHGIGEWFSKSVFRSVSSAIAQLPSAKFVPLIHQIASRLTTVDAKHQGNDDGETFQNQLQKLVYRCGCDHPHHTMPVVLALCRTSDPKRSQAARGIVKQFRNASQRMDAEVESLRALMNACLRLAEIKHKKGQGSVSKTDKDAFRRDWKRAVKSRRNTRGVRASDPSTSPQVLTFSPLRVSPDKDYASVPRMVRFKDRVELSKSGIHRPKIVVAVGSDGNEYKQLIKGHDDTKGDAVMEQVFEMVNSMLRRQPRTRERNLCIRTYRVVPLSDQAGIIEWVGKTQPLGEWLYIGKNSAHVRYKSSPKEYAPKTCMEKMKEVKDKSREKRLETFLDITRHFKPVFRHYFTEKFPDPEEWFRRRLAYTRSVASNSMVGHILGIGDRHLLNILISSDTAELVHIDFGYVFEQGFDLTTPEQVPFRLTRDIVDGMGCTGCEGVFRRSCEETMRVLRGHIQTETILTLLEVFIGDPLYRWTRFKKPHDQLLRSDNDGDTTVANRSSSTTPTTVDTSTEADARSNDDRDASELWEKDAKQVLTRVRQKLRGQEEVNGEALGVAGQISRLLNEARDKEKLSLMFHGWASWV